MKKVRFIHTGDLHLGSPLKTVGAISPELRESLHESIFTAFRNIVDAALRYNVDFVLISGDIYDNESRSVRGNRFFSEEMARLDQVSIPVFIIYGNHDPIGQTAEFFRLPANVQVLGANSVETREITDELGRPKARVLGQSYATPREPRKIYLNYKTPKDGLLGIGMLHTGLSAGANAYVPCSPADLKDQTGIHYWALGHIHSPTLVSDSSPLIAYPGIPQGRDVKETGLKGCLLVELEAPNSASIQFIPTSPIIWLNYELSVPPSETLATLDDLADFIAEQGQKILRKPPENPLNCPMANDDFQPDGYVVRWEITGRNPIHDTLLSGRESEVTEDLKEMLNARLTSEKPFLWTEGIKFHTASPIPNLKDLLQRDDTVKTLFEIQTKIQKEPGLRDKAISAMGAIWYEPRREGDVREDAFPITHEKLNSLLKDAFNMAVERIIKERENH